MPAAWVRALGVFGLAAMLVLLGMWLGHGLATTQALADKAAAAEKATQQLLQAQADGEAAVAGVQEQLRLQKSYQSNLAERQRHAPLTAPAVQPRPLAACAPGAGVVPAAGLAGLAAGVAAAGPGLGGDGGAAAAGGDLAGAADASGLAGGAPGRPGDATSPGDGEVEAAAADVQLSLAAVSLWNSALAGRDVPAGACSPAGAAEPACTAAAGLSLDDAWANQRTNAASCAADRARYQALIDYLQQRAQR